MLKLVKIYNTLTKQLDTIEPNIGKTLKMFVCGPTVYSYIHAGNARTFVIFDAFAKYLRHRGYKLDYLQNITDIDDRIIAKAQKENIDWKVLAMRFEEQYLSDIRTLKIDSITNFERATDHIQDIIDQISRLVEKGYAYEITDGIYFDLSKFPEYGKLSGRTSLQADDAVSRIDENSEKRNTGDFCLWKRSKDGEPSWPSPWFDGRPGWHIEDTAITEASFGPQYDLHGGGRDLIFPHHEAEIAQQESSSGKVPFVKYWMHPGFLTMKESKMSKSVGNIESLHDLLQKYSPEAIRFFLLSSHWRSPLDFSEVGLKQAEAAIMRITEFLDRMKMYDDQPNSAHQDDKELSKSFEKIEEQLHECLDNDFNTPMAFALLFDVLRLANQYWDSGKIDMHSATKIRDVLSFYDKVLGIIPIKHTHVPEDIMALVKERSLARDSKNWSESDRLRGIIIEKGWQIDDTAYGPLIKER